MQTKFVSYLRVSTGRQFRSGLGLAAQKQAVEAYVSARGGSIVREFTEVESGANDARPKLAEALAFAGRAKAVLLVAKLDRLSRSIAFIAKVLDSGAAFAAVDMPEANHVTLHIMGSMAQHERKMISDRTKAAMQVAKSKGKRFGTHDPRVPTLTAKARQKGAVLGAEANRSKALREYRDLLPYIASLQGQGFSLRQIAQRLNDDGQETRTGKQWSAPQVLRLLRRAA